MDGTTWTFGKDGRYLTNGEVPDLGGWRLADTSLTLENLGSYTLVELDAEQMTLRLDDADYAFARTCGEDVDRANKVTALRRAAAYGKLDVVQALLGEGVDINAVDVLDHWQRTALFAAVENRQHAVVALLLERGADVQVVNAMDKPLLAIAERINDPEILKLLAPCVPSHQPPARQPVLASQVPTDSHNPVGLDPSALSNPSSHRTRANGSQSTYPRASSASALSGRRSAQQPSSPSTVDPGGRGGSRADYCASGRAELARVKRERTSQAADSMGMSIDDYIQKMTLFLAGQCN